jgi:hypothetical protein
MSVAGRRPSTCGPSVSSWMLFTRSGFQARFRSSGQITGCSGPVSNAGLDIGPAAARCESREWNGAPVGFLPAEPRASRLDGIDDPAGGVDGGDIPGVLVLRNALRLSKAPLLAPPLTGTARDGPTRPRTPTQAHAPDGPTPSDATAQEPRRTPPGSVDAYMDRPRKPVIRRRSDAYSGGRLNALVPRPSARDRWSYPDVGPERAPGRRRCDGGGTGAHAARPVARDANRGAKSASASPKVPKVPATPKAWVNA